MIKSKLFINYMFSYLIVFFVPFVIMSSIIYLQSVSNLKQEIEQSNLAQLQQVANITNERVNELESISNRISQDPRLTPYMINHQYYGLEAIDELKKYKANSSILEELLIYYHQSNTIYSSEGSYSIPAFINRYNFLDIDMTILDGLLHSKIPYNVPFERKANYGENDRFVAYFVPLTFNSNSTYGSAVYLIKEKSLNELIQNVMGDFKGNAYILSADNEVLASSIKDTTVNIAELDFAQSENQRINPIKINNENYSMASVESSVTQWKFVIVMETNQFFERLADTQLLVILLCISVFVIGGLLAVLLARKQYNPIRSLFDSVSHNRKVNKGINELETIKQTVTSVFEEHEKLSETVFQHQSFARDQFLTKVLKGDFKKEAEIKNYIDTLQLHLSGDYYASFIISFEHGRSSSRKLVEHEKVYEIVNSFTMDDVNVYGVDLLYVDAIALIVRVNGGANAAVKKRNHFVEMLQEELQQNLSMKSVISIGSIVDKLTLINRSYIEALTALEYKLFYTQGSCIYYEDIEQEQTANVGYPKEELLKIVQSVKHGDNQVAKESLHSIFDSMHKKEISAPFLKAICYEIINTIIKTISEVGVTPQKEQLEAVFDFQSFEDLYEELSEIIEQACNEVNNNKKSHNDQLRNNIIHYLDENYHLYDLSLEKLALEFQLSASYVSRFIKEQTGYNFKQYVQQLRIEKVKQDLATTDKPIKSIVLDVGYKDVANFTRKFKNIAGITPGKYRQVYGKQTGTEA
ncbi:AraC family transcriptional regulator [Gracilibacillus oryzae]|uniref:AraC family transcriptional regulator n=1 Tax=Gracilibacillus oryzae TaxID=1672701 RepID=A0A7C8KPV7_9BACI|nr:helix-turn-helix domain-containing protein [Gracilibacillus oryzae]KAB8134184.1 AraC family transcriptional regulator [Gracilibacillus oryzae]